MILSDRSIKYAIGNQELVIEPFIPENVQPASYDVTLGDEIQFIHPWSGEVEKFDGRLLRPGDFLLGTTVERVEIPDTLVARLEGKSTLGRKGLKVHATAGYIDPGFHGQITLEISTLAPFYLSPGMLIGQLSFMEVYPVDSPYDGKYQNQSGPTAGVWKKGL